MKKLFLLILVCSVVFSAFAQDQKRPKIGVVLSGGGAKGLAHIGVLKVLDEAGVKVDYIGGTSMGAIIGGLYASGYTAKQLDSIFRVVDADALLQDYIPRTSKSFFEKRNDEVYALTLPFNKFKLGVPTALSKGMYNYNLLSRLTNHVRLVRDFDKLPIPFVCIATDIENGEKVVLKSGILPKAVLASGAFPSLYTPVEIDGRLLIDGGVTDNYPIEEVKKMGADIIIGVDVQEGLKDRNNLGGASGVLVQITNFNMIEKMEAKRKATDIYIKPDIKGYSVISFDLGQEIIKKGEEAAFSVYEKIAQLGSTEKPVRKHIPMTQLSDTIDIDDFKVNALNNYTRAYVLGKLRFKNNYKITFQKLSDGISNLSSTQNFSAISYSFVKNGQREGLVMELKENPVKRYLKFGVHYDGLYKSAALINVTQKKVFFKNDNISLDVILGDNFRYNLNYYYDNGFYWSFGVNSRYNQFNRNIATDFNNGFALETLGTNSININFSDFTQQIFAQTVFAQKFLVGGGTEWKHLKIESETLGDSGSVLENSSYASLYGYLKFDSQDKNYFAKKGWHFFGDFKSFVYSSDYTNTFEPFSIAKADIELVQTVFKRIAVKIQSEGGFAIGERTIPFHDFVLGGYGYSMINNFRHFYGYDFLSISGDSYVKGEVAMDYEFYKKNHFNISANFANVGNAIFEDDRWISRPKYSGYALGYGLETFVGPIELKHTWSPETRNHFTWISVGFWF
ncbi:putative patatin-like phospholipase [Flavobacterium cauense R2A-7]|uniref:NTE family protein n=1 Tax=Flavobacterium cauense R2A-7 TaxID=1341154 RepID=V6RY04_9FLAO|nr:patatin-like phospholipase family protein [Flavobacterium cauense]ESU19371.1 putative patatin-like phospholipase [Flavobacterium cauense R2A-7]KGO80335.1 patatin [Flavobacterium cauense R2A-7]TWI09338.1 NTE family protein [Flavobacterium cauense R2A-7]